MVSDSNAIAAYRRVLDGLLTPLVRFSLRRGLPIHEFEESAKRVYVRVASEELGKTTHKINASRLSVATGIYRSEVVRLLEAEPTPEDSKPQGILSKVLSKWERDPRFQTRAGNPKTLTPTGESESFEALVADVSKHINHASVLFELKRTGAVEEIDGKLRLTRGTEKVGEHEESAFTLAAKDLSTLLDAIEFNVQFQAGGQGHMHYRTEYDNIPPSRLPEIRAWLVRQGQVLHRRIRAYLAQFDRDTSSLAIEQEEGRVSVAVTSFSFAARLPE